MFTFIKSISKALGGFFGGVGGVALGVLAAGATHSAAGSPEYIIVAGGVTALASGLGAFLAPPNGIAQAVAAVTAPAVRPAAGPVENPQQAALDHDFPRA